MAVDLDGDGAADLVTTSQRCPAAAQPAAGPPVRCYDTWRRSSTCRGPRRAGLCRVRREPVTICDDPGDR